MDEKTQEFISDATKFGYYSHCCGAPVVLGDICTDCKEHCEPIKEIDE